RGPRAVALGLCARGHRSGTMTATPAPLAPELMQGLKRTQLAHFRPQAAEILQTATTQRWSPEQFLRTLLSTEIAGRDAAHQAARLKRAGVPVATVNCVASLEVLQARENLCLIGPAGTGKSHLLVAAGRAAVLAGYKVKYVIAADLVETLYRGLADNTVGKGIDTLLRNDAVIVDE